MSLFSGKYLALLTLAFIALLFLIGVLVIKARPYACLDNDRFVIAPKVEVFQWGSFHIFTYPIKHECPIGPDRYDPKAYPNKDNYAIPANSQ